jgi:two-component system, chemotaxis family, sensor kinase CheA
MDEFIEQFLLEARENVELASDDLLALEIHAQDHARLDSAFRAFHTLKGGAGIVGFTAMASAVHVAEDVLADVRSGTRIITGTLIGHCLACLDQVTQWLNAMEASGKLPDAPEAQADALTARFASATSEAFRPLQPQPTAVPADWTQPLSGLSRAILDAQIALVADPADAAECGGRVASAGFVAANVLRNAGRLEEAERVARATEQSLAQQSADTLRDAITGAIDDSRFAASGAAPPAPGHDEGAARTLRVDASRIDALVNLTGELTVAKNAFAHVNRLAQDSASPLAVMLKERQAVLERLVAELQQSVLAMRVRPLQSVFQRFSRVVREMSSEIGKPARLVVEGGETEADKAIVEMLFEPLLHVVRNAMGHGVESAPIRAAANKPATATISMRGLRQEEHVVIEVSDDGAGIDVDRIRRVALERNAIAPDALAGMNEDDLVNLIFAPGFSTASIVTGLSGRGVGMDSVKTAVQRVGGRVAVESRAGHGTTVRFTLPFSVVMTRVMMVGVAAETFAIPLDAVVENLRVAPERVVPVGASQAIVIRDQTVPVIELADALGLPSGGGPRLDATLVVIRAGGALGALRVDRVGEPMEVMLKPLEGLLAETRGIAGSTLLGDGRVLLILNLEEIFS